MISTHGKLLISAFVVILLGAVLIQPVANDIESVKVSSYTILNETLTFSTGTSAIINETHIVTGNETLGFTINLTYDDLTTFTELRNESATVVNTLCNVTLTTGSLSCNGTNSTNLYCDYTYVSRVTETLANDELISIDAIRNASAPSSDMTGICNTTLSSGTIVCDNTHNRTGYADYKYEPDTYVHSSAARTLLTLTILFFAIMVLAIGIGFVIKSLKESDLM